MVLELTVPHGADCKVLLPLWPVFMSYDGYGGALAAGASKLSSGGIGPPIMNTLMLMRPKTGAGIRRETAQRYKRVLQPLSARVPA